MSKIKLLQKNIVDKIAAGEVVVNGASVLKELMENSLDAGAKNINISILKGGKTLIRVQDDGEGISPEDIPLAFQRNATSKITDSIDAISTLGFRGEALASIAFVSKITLITKTKEDECGTRTVIREAEIISQEDYACNTGTVIEISDLFYNIPARRKHLESDRAETLEIIDIASKLALSHPDVSIRISCDGKEVFYTKSNLELITNIKLLFGKLLAESLIPIEIDEDPLFCKGFISSPNFINERHSQRITIVNGRYVQVDLISQIIDNIYEEFYGKKGADYILFIDLPAYMVDVNIHPAKMNVRFQNESLIILLLKQGIKNFLKQSFIIKEPVTKQKNEVIHHENTVFDGVKNYMPETANAYFEDNTVQASPQPLFIKEASDIKYGVFNREPKTSENNIGIAKDSQEQEAVCEDISQSICVNKDLFLTLKNMKYVGNAFGVYAMFEAGDNIYAVDTHAAHERVLYDKYINAFKNNTLDIQTLLAPMVINLGVKDYKTVIDNTDKFCNLGFDVEDFSDNTIALRTIPYYLACEDISSVIRNIIEELDKTKNVSLPENRSDRLIRAACHNAVRGKENISEEEARALLGDLHKADMPFTCPHGRPVIGRINIRYFMKSFERI